jgi:hypothetical protein
MKTFRSMAFPALLIVAGLSLLLAANSGAIQLDSLAKFWPLAVVAAGLAQIDPLRGNEQR